MNRLSHFTFKDNKVIPESEKIILHFYLTTPDMLPHRRLHRFGGDGLLYLSTGDNTTPFDEPWSALHQQRFRPAGRSSRGTCEYDGRRTSSNTNDLRGKIIRIRVKEDATYEIPEGNLFKASR